MIKPKTLSVSIAVLLSVAFGRAQDLLNLERVLEIAYLNSPDIKKSELNLLQSRESLNAQRAAMKSRFSLNINPVSFINNRSFNDFEQEWYSSQSLESYGTFRISQPIVATDGTISLTNRLGWQANRKDSGDIGSYYSNNLSIQLDQPLFTYNQKKMELSEMELNLEKTLLSNALQKLNVEKQVSQYFYNLYQKQMSLNIAEEEWENQKISYEIIKNKVDAGLSAKEELWQAELNFANANSSVYSSTVALENAEDALKQSIGLPLNQKILILTDIDVAPVEVELDAAITYARQQRIEIRQSQIEIENAHFNLIRAKAVNEFKGNVSLAAGIFGEDKDLSRIYSNNNSTDNESVSLSFDIPLIDWGERKSKIKVAEAGLQSTELDLQNELIDIEMSLRQVYRNLKNLLIQIDIAEKSVTNAQLTHELNLEKYENGDLTSMDLRLSQEQLSEKKNSLTNALIEYKLELLNLKIQTLWDFEANESVIPESISGKE